MSDEMVKQLADRIGIIEIMKSQAGVQIVSDTIFIIVTILMVGISIASWAMLRRFREKYGEIVVFAPIVTTVCAVVLLIGMLSGFDLYLTAIFNKDAYAIMKTISLLKH
jgi:hypothetical protein